MADPKKSEDWDQFRDELNAFMTWRRMSAPDLAEQLGIGGEGGATRIRQWRSGNGRPSFAQLPQIVRALRMNARSRQQYDDWKETNNPDLEAFRDQEPADWTYLIVKMGLADPLDVQRAAELAITVERLEGRRQFLDETLVAQGQAGLSRLVSEVVATEEWAIAVWPAIEGPVIKRSETETLDLRLHVADRVDFRRIDGSAVSKDLVWDAFEDALKASRAVPAKRDGARWATADKLLNEDDSAAKVSSWSIRRLGAPHPSVVEAAHPRLPSVAVTSLTVGAWGNDVADHLSRLIGYGFTSTRDVATDLYGKRNDVQYGESRARMHGQMLRGSINKRVWGHYSADQEALADLIGDPDVTNVFTVYLSQPKRDFKAEAERLWARQQERQRAGTVTAAEDWISREDVVLHLTKAHQEIESMLERVTGENLFVKTLSGAKADSTRAGKYRQCLDIAVEVLAMWFERRLVNRTDVEAVWDGIARKPPRLQTDGDRHTLMLAEYFRYVENAEKGRQ